MLNLLGTSFRWGCHQSPLIKRKRKERRKEDLRWQNGRSMVQKFLSGLSISQYFVAGERIGFCLARGSSTIRKYCWHAFQCGCRNKIRSIKLLKTSDTLGISRLEDPVYMWCSQELANETLKWQHFHENNSVEAR